MRKRIWSREPALLRHQPQARCDPCPQKQSHSAQNRQIPRQVDHQATKTESPDSIFPLRKFVASMNDRSGANLLIRWAASNGKKAPMIGIGGHLAAPPLPHHRAYGSVPRRFDRVKRGQERGGGE